MKGSPVKLKTSPEDFEVEEVPAYQPSGEGEHLYLWVEKKGRSTAEAARALARHLGISERDISYAGMKDKVAITRQLFSVPAKVEAEVKAFVDPDVKVLWAKRHKNKLRTGHLWGNRFTLRARGVADAAAVSRALEQVAREGMPNFFGEQRFGKADDNAGFGKKLLLRQKLEKKPDRFQRKLYLSAFQSLLFNRLLEARLREGTLSRALRGDVLKKHETGGEFVCADPATDQPRMDAFEVSAAGPLFGPEMTPAAAEVAAAEEALLRAEGLQLSDFERGGGETEGARRFYRVRPIDAAAVDEGEGVVKLTFALPRGSYATVLIDYIRDISLT
jgi:tRNA pseudouridine13 synthase